MKDKEEIKKELRRIGLGALVGLGIGAAIVAWTAAFAQPAPSGFAPYTVTFDQHQALIQYLMQQPYAFAEPVVRRLTELEGEAQHAAAQPKEQPAAPAPPAEPAK